MTTNRRDMLGAALPLGAAGLLGASATAQAQVASAPRTLFSLPVTTVPVVGSEMAFPVRRIYCIGRNYAAHAREMGSDPTREPPFFFQKPSDAVQNVPPGKTVDHPYPTLTKNYHYEIELVAALHKGGRIENLEAALLDEDAQGPGERAGGRIIPPHGVRALGPSRRDAG